jgi:hypothetical protein
MIVERRKVRAATGASLLFILASYGVSQQTAPRQDAGTTTADLASMDLQQLMDIKVTTASLFTDKLSEARALCPWSPATSSAASGALRSGRYWIASPV